MAAARLVKRKPRERYISFYSITSYTNTSNNDTHHNSFKSLPEYPTVCLAIWGITLRAPSVIGCFFRNNSKI
jgi:hypothetical protein